MKKISGFLHLWLGLITGIIVFIVSITGCIFVFEKEIFDSVHSDLVYVPKADNHVKPVSLLRKSAQAALGQHKDVGDLEISSDLNRAYVFSASKGNKKEKKGWTYFDQVEYWDEVYVDQYTGMVLGVVDRKFEFFNLVRRLHQNLLLRYDIGSMIVGTSCLIFILMLITGLILWIPKTRAGWKQRFTIKFIAKWRRVNYDTHNVGGFYVMPVALIIVASGLVWSFDWWELGIYKMLGSKEKPKFNMEQPLTGDTKITPNAEDVVLSAVLPNDLKFERLSLSFPEKTSQPIRVFIQLNSGLGWRESNYYFFNSITGKQFGELLQENKTLGEKWRNTNYDIHTGTVYGLSTQILALLASAFCATLPVTGFMIWYGRRMKGKKKLQKGMKTESQMTMKLNKTQVRKAVLNSN